MKVRLFAITDLAKADRRMTLARAQALLERVDPRVLVFGVRDHEAPAAQRCELARALVQLVRPVGARVVVHDRADVAAAADADGVHLAERSIDVADARILLGGEAWIGRSCHDERGLRAAAVDAVDAVTLSPVFASPDKGVPLGLERFAALRAAVPALEVWALGGVAPGNAADVLAAGASGLAMIRAWLVDDLAAWQPVFDRLGG